MKILHVSAECYPIAKVGGLADVVGALPKYQNTQAVVSEVIMPLYKNSFTKNNTFTSIHQGQIDLGGIQYPYEIKILQKNTLGFEVFFVFIPNLLFTDFVYSYEDTDRFLAFQIAVLDWLLSQNSLPDIVHCHDHHTGLIPFMMTQSYVFKDLQSIPTILTIHNAQYQGWFSYDKLAYIPDFDKKHIGLLDWDGQINQLAAGIKCAWRVTTVSPGYMEELKKNANGLEALLQHEQAKCIGILNGIDTKVWNPETDPYIEKKYVARIVQSGKKANKRYLCKRFGLDASKALLVFIGRLVGEKGADLFPEVFDLALKDTNCTILLLGSGHKETEEQLQALAFNGKHKGFYNCYIGYDEALSHKMYAGADFLLMPSRVEPCGLNQMYALRYGTIPIVRGVGGLKDTIVDIERDGFGIVHHKTSVPDILQAIRKAEKLYQNQQKFRKLRAFIMQINHSWDTSAKAYLNLYKSVKQ